MSLDVRLSRGEHPKIAVTGRTIETLRADQLDDLLSGRDDLMERVSTSRAMVAWTGCNSPATTAS